MLHPEQPVFMQVAAAVAAVAVSFTTVSQFLKLGCLLASLFSQARGSAGEAWVEESAGGLSWQWEGASFLPSGPLSVCHGRDGDGGDGFSQGWGVCPLRLRLQVILLFKKCSVFWAQADMLDQEAAFVQIQEAKTMVEEDLQRRLEEFEDEKEQLQKTVASAAALEQQLEQASPSGARVAAPGPRPAARGSLVLVCPSCRQTRWGFASARGLLCRSFTQKAASRASVQTV